VIGGRLLAVGNRPGFPFWAKLFSKAILGEWPLKAMSANRRVARRKCNVLVFREGRDPEKSTVGAPEMAE